MPFRKGSDMNRLIIAGSIRREGKSDHLARALAARVHACAPADEVFLFSLADDVTVDACLACDYCKTQGECIIDDDMQDVYDLLDRADDLVVVSPVYFASPPAQFKAVLDRLQRYYWTDFQSAPKRPAHLFVIGDGGDPHGYAPLVGTVRSALSVAGFRVSEVHDCVGKSFEELDGIAAAWEPSAGTVEP